MRKPILLAVFIVVFHCCASAISIEPGYFSDPKLTSGTLSLNGDFSSQDIFYGIVLNANLSGQDYGLESAVVKYIEYDDMTLGIRYAPIEDMSFGYGMLLNDLNTMYYQPAHLMNEQCGLRVYYDFNDFVLEGMGTYSHLYGIRLKDFSFLNMNFGFEYLSDANMVSREGYGRAACGAYIELPLTDEFSFFGEGAGTSSGGEGNMAGASFDYDLIFAYSKLKVAAVSMNDRFIPGYFTSGYDLNPVDFSALESEGRRRYGTMSSINMGLLGYIAFDYMNENYTDGGSANSGSFLIVPVDRLNITGFIKELSFLDYRAVKGKNSSLVGGTIEYKMRNGIHSSLNYKKSLIGESLNLTDDLLRPFETYYFKIGYTF
ncbi:MAG: hypothetical protein ABH860_06340 [bacterium]